MGLEDRMCSDWELFDALHAWWSRTILLHRTIQLMNVFDCGNSS